jgi:uncharacterized protein YjiS (DUF1127 family)
LDDWPVLAEELAGRLGDGLSAGMSSLAEGTLGALQAWRQGRDVNRTMERLSRLDDASLREIGVQRCQIPIVARIVVERPGADPRRMTP